MRVLITALIVLVSAFAPWTAAAEQRPVSGLSPVVHDALEEALHRPYLELFEEAAAYEFSPTQIAKMRESLEKAEKACAKRLSSRVKSIREERTDAQSDLRKRSAKLSDEERHDLHCRVQNRRIEEDQMRMFVKHSVPLAYDHYDAKLDLLEFWPLEQRAIRQEIASGAHHDREFGDVKDIAFRSIRARR